MRKFPISSSQAGLNENGIFVNQRAYFEKKVNALIRNGKKKKKHLSEEMRINYQQIDLFIMNSFTVHIVPFSRIETKLCPTGYQTLPLR